MTLLHTLAHLTLKARGNPVQVEDLLQVVVFAAAFRLSIHQACHDLEEAPSGAKVVGALAMQLSDLEHLEETLNTLLARLVPHSLGLRGRRVAIDLLELPYHGGIDDANKDEGCRGKAKQGTPHFFTYATASVILGGRRYTLALCRVRATMTMEQGLKRLLLRIHALGIRVSVLLRDRGFYRVRVIRELREQRQPFIRPAIKRGKKPAQPGGPSGTQVMAQWTASGWTSYTLRSQKDGHVTLDLAVVCHNLQGRWGRHPRETWLYAPWGLTHRPLPWIRPASRRRFGIESSYRQVHQAKIKTSTRTPVLRLLFVGVAFILRNVWVWLHADVMAQPRRGGRRLQGAALRFGRLWLWLVLEGSALSALTRNSCPARHLQGRTGYWYQFQLLNLVYWDRLFVSDVSVCMSSPSPSTYSHPLRASS